MLAMNLAALGWSPFFADALAGLNRPELRAARVVGEDKHAVVLVGEGGELQGMVPGRLLHRRASDAELPKVGDWVAMTQLPGEAKAVVEVVLPRRSRLVRKVTGRESEEQVLAANVNTVFLVQALDQTFNARRLERFLVMALEGGVRPVVALNKVDVCPDPEPFRAATAAVAGSAPVLVLSAKTRKGLGELRAQVQPGETVCFLGTSGAGKSSLINRLCGEELLPTIEVREKDSKGRHTTTRREILPLPNGALVMDTPGMREFHLWDASDGLHEAFPDVFALAAGCQFRDCSHTHEAACAVKAAVAAQRFAADRYQSYLKLHAEQTEVHEAVKTHQRQEKHRKAHLSRLRHGLEAADLAELEEE